jgi:hypothetical protein
MELMMNVKKQWLNYCSGRVNDSTQDDWNNFVLKLFSKWQAQQLKQDQSRPQKTGNDLLAYAATHYSFEHFIQGSQIYQELLVLEPNRHET